MTHGWDLSIEEQALALEAEGHDTPCCGKCGHPITTGFMVFICPHGPMCDFYPEDAAGREIVERWRATGRERGK